MSKPFEFSMRHFEEVAGKSSDCPVGMNVGKDKLLAWCSLHRKNHPVDIDGVVKP